MRMVRLPTTNLLRTLLFCHAVIFGDAHSQVEQDSLALVTLYENTSGENWAANFKWLTDQPLETWHGIGIADGRVTEVALSMNNLVGTLPTELGDLTELQALFLGINRLSGPIPTELGNLTNLSELFLEFNELTGPLPDEFGNLTDLMFLMLAGNQLNGPIPPEIGQLSNLLQLDLSRNQFSGTLPREIGNLSELQELVVFDNQLTGSIPLEIGNLLRLRFLFLQNNRLEGSIPDEIGNLSALTHLNLSTNQLTGTIPAYIGDLLNLTALDLSSNQLSGTIPSALVDLVTLTELDISSNQFSGPIPLGFEKLINLQTLWFQNNQLSGDIPPKFGNIFRLRQLNLSKNQLSGSIPSELGGLRNLKELHLNFNQLSGFIPSQLSNLSTLTILRLDNNELEGKVSTNFSGLRRLQELNVSNNQLTELPDLSSITPLTNLQVQNNKLTFEDIEPNLGFPIFLYAPQDSVGTEKNITASLDSTLTLSVSVGGTANRYQWLKDGADIPEAQSSSYTITGLKATDAGAYACRITNTLATELTLYHRPITVAVADDPDCYLPLENGHSWTFEFQKVAQQSDTVTYSVTDTLVRSRKFYRFLNGPFGFDYVRYDGAGHIFSYLPETDTEFLLFDFKADAPDTHQIEIQGLGFEVILLSRNAVVDVPAGRFENCLHYLLDHDSDTGSKREVWFAYGVGLVQVRPTFDTTEHLISTNTFGSCKESPSVASSYFPIKAGNRWTYEISSNVGTIGTDSTEVIKKMSSDGYRYYLFDKFLPIYNLTGVVDSTSMRIDGNQVYVLFDSTEYLWYDFERAEHDTITFTLPTVDSTLNDSLTISSWREVKQFPIFAPFDDTNYNVIGFYFVPEAGQIMGIDYFVEPWGLSIHVFGAVDPVEYFLSAAIVNDNNFNRQTVSVEQPEADIPQHFLLWQNYPNPFNPETTIKYEITEPGRVTLSIYNILGQQIKVLVDEWKAPGSHKTQWDALSDRETTGVASGLYIYELKIGEKILRKKMLLIR